MDLDRQAIERRDFPISRRGYDAAAVDAHLQALAGEFEELQRAAAGGSEVSLATSTATQVQSIIHAAETAAAEIERQASEDARRSREEAERDAAATREHAIARARAHVAAVEQATATLLERIGALDNEAGSLVETLRTSTARFGTDLRAIEQNMAELYDSAAGNAPAPISVEHAPVVAATPPSGDPLAPARPLPAPSGAAPVSAQHPSAGAEPAPSAPAAPAAASGGENIDGARLVALNMAINGKTREETDLYLAENFELADRPRLIEEVYAAVGG